MEEIPTSSNSERFLEEFNSSTVGYYWPLSWISLAGINVNPPYVIWKLSFSYQSRWLGGNEITKGQSLVKMQWNSCELLFFNILWNTLDFCFRSLLNTSAQHLTAFLFPRAHEEGRTHVWRPLGFSTTHSACDYLLVSFRYDWHTIEMAIRCVRNMKKFQSLRFNNPHIYLEMAKKITQCMKISFKVFCAWRTIAKSSVGFIFFKFSQRWTSVVPRSLLHVL